MQSNSIPVLVPGDQPISLMAAEQKQIRETQCAVFVRGLRYPGELADARVLLSREFAQLRADSAKPKAKS